jgi:ankyrin repeat protein
METPNYTPFFVEYLSDMTDSDRETYLHKALTVENVDLDLVKFLIQNGASVNSKNSTGATPIHYATSSEAIELLLEHGADINQQDRYGWAPLHSAVVSGNLNRVRFLVESGANVNLKSCNDNNPLDLANRGNYTEIATFLEEHGAILAPKRDSQKWTSPIFYI